MHHAAAHDAALSLRAYATAAQRLISTPRRTYASDEARRCLPSSAMITPIISTRAMRASAICHAPFMRTRCHEMPLRANHIMAHCAMMFICHFAALMPMLLFTLRRRFTLRHAILLRCLPPRLLMMFIIADVATRHAMPPIRVCRRAYAEHYRARCLCRNMI